MFFTKKSIFKILALISLYFLLGVACGIGYRALLIIDISVPFLNKLSLFAYSMCIPIFLIGRSAEGKGILLNAGNKLVRNELRPADFIDLYNSVKNDTNLVIANPRIEVLQQVLLAYDLLDDREMALATVEEMITVAGEKKKAVATILKASLLYSHGRVEEAEALFELAQKMKLNAMANMLMDAVLKGDRAKAIGDYAVAEAYNLKVLERKFPPLANSEKLITHYVLGEIYEKLQENEKAIFHFQYCLMNGGETTIRKDALKKLEELKRDRTTAIEE